MASVRVFARIKAKASREREVRTILLDLVRGSRSEEGANFYELFETTDGGEFLVNEEYATAQDFEAHKNSDHFRAALAASEELLEEPISVWVVDPVEPVD